MDINDHSSDVRSPCTSFRLFCFCFHLHFVVTGSTDSLCSVQWYWQHNGLSAFSCFVCLSSRFRCIWRQITSFSSSIIHVHFSLLNTNQVTCDQHGLHCYVRLYIYVCSSFACYGIFGIVFLLCQRRSNAISKPLVNAALFTPYALFLALVDEWTSWWAHIQPNSVYSNSCNF